MGEDSDTGRIIVFVIIAIIYGLAAVVKKINQWAQENKARMQQMRRPDEGVNIPQVPEQRRDLPSTLLRDLERQLRDFQGLPPTTEAAQPQPSRQPQQPQRPAMQKQTASKTPYRAASHISKPRMTSMAAPQILSTTRQAAIVHRRHLDHLAVLRSADDLKRGIVLNEILSPPLAIRRGIIPAVHRVL